jgi:hypothetical protein
VAGGGGGDAGRALEYDLPCLDEGRAEGRGESEEYDRKRRNLEGEQGKLEMVGNINTPRRRFPEH